MKCKHTGRKIASPLDMTQEEIDGQAVPSRYMPIIKGERIRKGDTVCKGVGQSRHEARKRPRRTAKKIALPNCIPHATYKPMPENPLTFNSTQN